MRGILLILLFSVGCKDSSLVGEWRGQDRTGSDISFVFRNADQGLIISEGQSVDFSYRIDQSKSPMWLDLVLAARNDPADTMRGIVDRVNADLIRLRLGHGERAQEFTPVNDSDPETLFLRRVDGE